MAPFDISKVQQREIISGIKKITAVLQASAKQTALRSAIAESEKIDKESFIRTLRTLESSVKKKEAASIYLFVLECNAHTNNVTGEAFFKLLEAFQHEFNAGKDGSSLFIKDEVFPTWLALRADFQELFPRFAPPKANVETEDLSTEVILQEALSVLPLLRTPHHIHILCNWAHEQPALKSLGALKLQRIAAACTYQGLEKGKVLFRQGDKGDAFYVIVTGEVAIIMDRQQVGTLGPGQSFGEQALENQAPRSATILALQPCELMKITAETFNSTILQENTKAHKESSDFLHTKWAGGSYGKEFPYLRLHQLALDSYRQTFSKNKVVFDQGEETSIFYIVFSGAVALQKVISTDLMQTSRSNGCAPKEEILKDHNRVIQLQCLQVGNFFGEDTLFDFVERQYRAVAIQDGTELIIIHRRHIRELFTHKHKQEIYKACSHLYVPAAEVESRYQREIALKKHVQKMKVSALGPSYSTKIAKAEKRVHFFNDLNLFNNISTQSGHLDLLLCSDDVNFESNKQEDRLPQTFEILTPTTPTSFFQNGASKEKQSTSQSSSFQNSYSVSPRCASIIEKSQQSAGSPFNFMSPTFTSLSRSKAHSTENKTMAKSTKLPTVGPQTEVSLRPKVKGINILPQNLSELQNLTSSGKTKSPIWKSSIYALYK